LYKVIFAPYSRKKKANFRTEFVERTNSTKCNVILYDLLFITGMLYWYGCISCAGRYCRCVQYICRAIPFVTLVMLLAVNVALQELRTTPLFPKLYISPASHRVLLFVLSTMRGPPQFIRNGTVIGVVVAVCACTTTVVSLIGPSLCTMAT
jgi:hypothetical protein